MQKPISFLSTDINITEGFKILGHDSAYSCIDFKRKQIIAFATERITRVKHDSSNVLQFFDIHTIHSDLNIGHSFNLKPKDKIFFFSRFYEYLFLPQIRCLLGVKYLPRRQFNFPYLKNLFKLLFKSPLLFFRIIQERLFCRFVQKLKLHFVFNSHHLCHALPAYYFSPFSGKNPLIFILDGLGEDEYSSLWQASNDGIKLLSSSKATPFDRIKKYNYSIGNFKDYSSIGNLYGLFTYILGYQKDSDEGKTEALAAYGKPDNSLLHLCQLAYKINPIELNWQSEMVYVEKLHNKDFLKSELSRIGRESFAATIQVFLQNTVVEFLNFVHLKYPTDYLCLSGGVVANVIMNLHIWERTPFKNIYIFPAMGDDGTALGSAIIDGIARGHDLSWLSNMTMPYWGPSYSRLEVLETLKNNSDDIVWEDLDNEWTKKAAKSISTGKIIGVFHGKMEFGPRALGNRSILADPRNPSIREKMNVKIKKRPFFQPFCPSVLESERTRLFQDSISNKHMTMAFRLKEIYKEILPSACHIDGTARPQFVEKHDNPKYFEILSEFKLLTGYGIVINTSFNLHGRAMVMTPEDALADFLACNLDELFIEGFKVIRKL